MRIDSAFPSQYLKAADLQGRAVPVTIDRVEMEDIGGDHKPILYFVGKQKGMVLNKTNSNNIALLYGPETEDWNGKPIELFEAMVDFQGKTVPAIRVRPSRNGHAKEMPPVQPRRMETHPTDLDDEIPF